MLPSKVHQKIKAVIKQLLSLFVHNKPVVYCFKKRKKKLCSVFPSWLNGQWEIFASSPLVLKTKFILNDSSWRGSLPGSSVERTDVERLRTTSLTGILILLSLHWLIFHFMIKERILFVSWLIGRAEWTFLPLFFGYQCHLVVRSLSKLK